jgi:hypothetical protein
MALIDALTMVAPAKVAGLPLPDDVDAQMSSLEKLRQLTQPGPDPVLDLGNDPDKYAAALAKWGRALTDVTMVRELAAEQLARREIAYAGEISQAMETWLPRLQEEYADAVERMTVVLGDCPDSEPGPRTTQAMREAWVRAEDVAFELDAMVAWRVRMSGVWLARSLVGNPWILTAVPALPTWQPEFGDAWRHLYEQRTQWHDAIVHATPLARWRWLADSGWPLRLAGRGDVERCEEALERMGAAAVAGTHLTNAIDMGAWADTSHVRPGVELPR